MISRISSLRKQVHLRYFIIFLLIFSIFWILTKMFSVISRKLRITEAVTMKELERLIRSAFINMKPAVSHINLQYGVVNQNRKWKRQAIFFNSNFLTPTWCSSKLKGRIFINKKVQNVWFKIVFFLIYIILTVLKNVWKA